MNNPFQEQFLKAGIASKQQVHNAKKHKKTQVKKQRSNKKLAPDPNVLKAQQKAKEKADRDRELNQKKQLQAKNKAISVEIDQLIRDNKLSRVKDCELTHNFEHRNKINKLFVNADMKQKLVDGKLGIARIEGRYEVIPQETAEKIKQRNEKRVILSDSKLDKEEIDSDYADYDIPDDLMW